MASFSKSGLGILLSGGIDSACLCYWKKPKVAFNINYGQKAAKAERQASIAIADAIGVNIEFIDIDCSQLGSGDLTNEKALGIAPVSEWWPFRNQLLVTLACMKAIQYGTKCLIIGAVSSDRKHKDGRSMFFDKLSTLTKYQEGGIKITAPAINLSSVQLIRKSKMPLSILGWTHSCHVSNYPCGKCNGCLKHIATKGVFINF
jgi:7-cyano-7-deazaguanine synthase